MKICNSIYYNNDRVLLKTHHIKASMIKRIKKGHATVYDISVKDIYKDKLFYLDIAANYNIPVILNVINITRLLIFNKQYTEL